jgi:diadenosine tetraphosphate (Ap4A) HIT family hydrolase
MSPDCYSCATEAALSSAPPREAVHVEDRWRVAHAFDSALPGWLVLLPRRHVTALDDLDADEAADLGRLQVAVSRALREVTGCTKVYSVFFAEAEGFAHVHLHLVPRMDWFTREQVGPRVFSFLGAAEGSRVPAAEQDALALRLRTAFASA